jgi:hypothetical protein
VAVVAEEAEAVVVVVVVVAVGVGGWCSTAITRGTGPLLHRECDDYSNASQIIDMK